MDGEYRPRKDRARSSAAFRSEGMALAPLLSQEPRARRLQGTDAEVRRLRRRGAVPIRPHRAARGSVAKGSSERGSAPEDSPPRGQK